MHFNNILYAFVRMDWKWARIEPERPVILVLGFRCEIMMVKIEVAGLKKHLG